MINSLLSFGAKSVNPEILEQTLTIREDIVDEIEKTCVQKVLEKSTCQSLVIAPRGSGKTHIVKVLYHRLKNNPKISDKSVIAYMTEDEVGIANFTDLMISMLRSFIRYKEPGSSEIENKIEEASLIKDANEREIFVKNVLNDFAQKRIILLLIENFDKILNSLGDKGQRNLRSYIHQYNKLSIIATSQNLIANLQNSKNAFYNFFNVQQLKKLDFNQSVEFLKSIAKSENNTNLLKELEEQSLEGKLRAIYELTEGNHRLLVTFYTFLKAELKTELSVIFIKVMNDLKPYYEQFINVLPAQQQKIVKFLSMKRGAISGKEIARACFIEPNVFSKQASLLFNNGMIDKNPSGKNTFYELKEPLMRICFEISESSNGIAKLFVDFLSCFYDSREIRNKYVLYKYGGKFLQDDLRNKYEKEAMMFDAALDNEERAKIIFGHHHYIKVNDLIELNEILQSSHSNVTEKIDQSYDYFNLGNKSVKKGKLQEALEYYKKVLDFDSNNEIVNFNIGLTYSKLKENDQAILYFEETIKINPKNIQSYIGLGHSYGVLKQYDKAKKYYSKALEIDQNDYWAHYGLGTIFLILHKYNDCIRYLENAIKINSDIDGPYLSLGRAYFEVKNIDDSIINYEKAISLNPQLLDAYIDLGDIFFELNEFEKAKINYEKAIQVNKNSESANIGLGKTLIELNSSKEATFYLKTATEINPNSSSGFFNLGILYITLGMFEKAVKSFEKLIKFDAENEEVFNGLAISYGSMGNSEKAIENFRNALQLNSKNTTAHYGLGVAFLDQKDFPKAIIAFKKALKSDPSNHMIFYHLGIAYFNVHKFEKAIENFVKFIDKEPNNIDAYNYIGVTYLFDDKIEKAFDTFNIGLKLEPENNNLRFSQLGAYIRINDLNNSKKTVKELLSAKVDDELLQISLTEDIFYNLFKYGSNEFIKYYLNFLFKELTKSKRDNQFWKSLTDSLFEILINVEDYDKERLDNILNTITQILGENEKSIIPFKMFRVGILHIKQNEKTALFELSKEERKVFTEAVLNKRNLEG